ncbi:MAG: PDZ domain-containing protein [Planctomycetaceae bacterium]|nr:PDZ domain-containing protein [Planctomycetaceae bacterium]
MTRFTFRILILLIIVSLLIPCSSAQSNKDENNKEETAVPNAVSKPDESKSWATLGRLYVVTVTDDELEGVPGQVALKNGKTIEALFQNNLASGAFAVIKVPAGQITRQTIFSLISNLPVKSQDAICLYISGKGNKDRKYGTFFELSKSKEELYRSELRSALAKKNCRLGVLISDFCDGKEIPVKPEPKPEAKPEQPETENNAENTEQKKPETVTEEPKKSSEPETAQTETPTPEMTTSEEIKTSPLFFSLFFQSTGVVDILSSNPTQNSLPSDKGIGCFTEAFSGLLEANKNKSLSWYRLFPYLNRGTGLIFEGIYVDGADFNGLKQISQAPVLLTLGQENYSSEIFSEVYPRGNDFDSVISGVTDKEVALTDDDSKTITKLVQAALNVIRPQNDHEKGSHENYAALDPDNTVNGVNGNPFSTTLSSLSPASTSTPTPTSTPTSNPNPTKVKIGVRVLDNKGDGVLVTQILPSFPGAKAGLETGDVILSINGKKITSEKEYSDAVDAADREMKLEVRNKNGGHRTTVIVQITAP